MSINSIMHKGIFSVSDNMPIKEIAIKMYRQKIGAVIIGSTDKIEGIFSERDLLNKVVGPGLSVETTMVKDVMTKNVITINVSDSAENALKIMEGKGIRHLPVVDDNGKCVGMLGMRDLMHNMVESLEKENKKLNELDKLKDEFLANTSHELRTPLNGIIGLAESMIDGATGKLNDIQVHNLSMLVSSGRRLANLVNDILDFSKLKHKNIGLQLNAIGIKEVTDIVIAISAPLLGNKDIKLENNISPEIDLIYADENRVHQIIHNLIGNSIKFTEKGKITISAKPVDEMLEITVSDTGIGISEDKIDRIFYSFEQGDGSTSRKYGGTGIGLTITKQLIELHGGKIRVESSPDSGSKFIFTLPLADNKDRKNYKKSESNKVNVLKDNNIEIKPITYNDYSEENGFRILIVDDEPTNLQVLANQLSLQKYSITQALNGVEALSIINESMKNGEKFDLILLDIMMPKMTGYETCQKIRELYPASQLPVVMLTAKNQISDLVEGFDMGANDYLVKPFSKNELFSRIKTHLQLAKINVAYSRFVPSIFLSFLGHESILDVKLGDQIQKEMTVLFSDIRAFTTLSESMTPKENFDFINSYLSKVSPVIRENNGYIDKYIGDGIMALFPTSPDDALKASIKMLEVISLVNPKRAKDGYKKIEIGIGLHTGTLMLGTIGEQERMEGTVIADAVNLASRLEGLTKIYGSSIIISEQFLNKLERPEIYNYRFLDKVKVKGKNTSVSIFEIFDGESQKSKELKIKTYDDYINAIRLFTDKKFDRAYQILINILKINPNDKAAELYEKRCEHILKYGLEEEWTGIYSMSEK